jgi:hypothetical protein
VSGINRDTCQASAEALTSINRDAFIRHQPKQHTLIGAADRNRTRNLLFTKQLLCQLSYGGASQ